jgi:hypothetical protein
MAIPASETSNYSIKNSIETRKLPEEVPFDSFESFGQKPHDGKGIPAVRKLRLSADSGTFAASVQPPSPPQEVEVVDTVITTPPNTKETDSISDASSVTSTPPVIAPTNNEIVSPDDPFDGLEDASSSEDSSSDDDEGPENPRGYIEEQLEGPTTTEAAILTYGAPPPNPFRKSSDGGKSSSERRSLDEPRITPERKSSMNKAGRASLDVDAFKRLMLTGIPAGNKAGTSSGPPPSSLSQPSPPIDSLGNSSTTSSLSRQSIFEPIQETQPDSPRTSHEINLSDDEQQSLVGNDPPAIAARKKPPPPKTRHGKLIKNNAPTLASKSAAPDVGPFNTNHPLPPIPATSPPAQVNKPLPPAPTSNRLPAEAPPGPQRSASHASIKEEEEPVEENTGLAIPASKTEQPLTPGKPEITGTSGTPGSRKAPAPPTRRHSQIAPMGMTSPSLARPIESTQLLSSLQSENTPPPISHKAGLPPPPPPPSRRRSVIQSKSSSSIPTLNSIPPTPSSVKDDPIGLDATLPSSSESSLTAGPPPPPPARTPSIAGSYKMRTNKTPHPAVPNAGPSAGMAPPPPPPPRHRGSSRGSMDSQRPVIPSSGRSSKEFRRSSEESPRRNSVAEIIVPSVKGAGGDVRAASADADEILANLTALQRDLDEFRGKFADI